MCDAVFFVFFFFNDTATTEIYTLSLHDALPISFRRSDVKERRFTNRRTNFGGTRMTYGIEAAGTEDRESTRLNSSHDQISYAVFFFKKKKKKDTTGFTAVESYDI